MKILNGFYCLNRDFSPPHPALDAGSPVINAVRGDCGSLPAMTDKLMTLSQKHVMADLIRHPPKTVNC
jgi:hypothetical protein